MTLKFNGITLDNSVDVKYNGTSIDKLQLDGVTVWEAYNGAKGVTLLNNCVLNNGILSNFDNNSYAIPTYIWKPTFNMGTPFEFSIAFNTNTLTTTNYLCQYCTSHLNQTGDQNFSIMMTSYGGNIGYVLEINARLVGTGAIYSRPSHTFDRPVYLYNNSKYYCKIYNNGYTTTKFYIDNNPITSESQLVHTVISNYTWNFSNISLASFGRNAIMSELGYYLKDGTIDLNYCYIKVNDQFVWKGV